MAQAKANEPAADPFDDIRKAVIRRFGAAAKVEYIRRAGMIVVNPPIRSIFTVDDGVSKVYTIEQGEA